LVVRASVAWVPLVANAPVQPPEAVQAVALVDFQVSVVVPPLATVVALALRDATGAVGAVGVTV
jgi:hypothetical protein